MALAGAGGPRAARRRFNALLAAPRMPSFPLVMASARSAPLSRPLVLAQQRTLSSVGEVAAFLRRLRAISSAGRPTERHGRVLPALLRKRSLPAQQCASALRLA